MSSTEEKAESEIHKISVNHHYLMKLYQNAACSDMTLVVDGSEFRVMRIVLSIQSTFFEALFNGSFEKQQQSKITLNDVKLKPFKLLLEYMYSGKTTVNTTDTEELIDLLDLAHFLGLDLALQNVADCIEKFQMDTATTVAFYNKAALFDLEKLQNTLLDRIVSDSKTYISSEIFNTFTEAAILKLLDSDRWTVDESTIVTAVSIWLSTNPITNRDRVLQKIRLTLIDTKILAINIRNTGLFTDLHILDAITKRERGNIENRRSFYPQPFRR